LVQKKCPWLSIDTGGECGGGEDMMCNRWCPVWPARHDGWCGFGNNDACITCDSNCKVIDLGCTFDYLECHHLTHAFEYIYS